ncbi:MAG: T9SS type A sorting domain-containing protein [Chitinophagales bacterium]|nr:T9SS type A sorting domain-containing protein [Chitinophagales bacterium]
MRNITISLLFITAITNILSAGELVFNQETYNNRLKEYRRNAIENFNGNAIPIQAYLGQEVDRSTLNDIIENMPTNGEFDFKLVQLVRILFFSHGEYDNLILPAIDTIPLWLTPNEDTRVYWSENHAMMWLSSAWLLKEKYGIDKDPDLRKKIVHDLDLKIDYGYYEFFSSVYFPYTLSALLNLVDFSKDREIHDKAVLATDRLLTEILLLVNNKGVFFPATARNYRNYYENAYGNNHNHLIYLLTGMGEKPEKATHAAAFLATSTYDVQKVVESWSSTENLILKNGHSISDIGKINQDLSLVDRVVFQWSGGAFFHPKVALETAQLLNDYNLWGHEEFKDFREFKNIPLNLAPILSEVASSISYSSVNTQANIAIFKNKGVTLSSIQNFWKGKAGYQQWPWSAAVDDIAVNAQTGDATQPLGEHSITVNSTLPYIQQKDNLALIMYRPHKSLKLFGRDKHDVVLMWDNDNFDEYREVGKWIVGRRGNSYIGVLRHCTDIINSTYFCDDQDGQLWACIVGNQDMYGSFENFVDKIRHSQYQEKWNYVFDKAEWHYYGMVKVDDIKLDYDWVEGLTEKPDDPKTDPLVTSVKSHTLEPSLNLYPNPAKDVIKIDLSILNSQGNIKLSIINDIGKTVFSQELSPSYSLYEVSTQNFSPGIYFLYVETSDGTVSQKLIIQ